MSNSQEKTSKHDPEWMNSANDEKLRKEAAPLFGTGDLSLQDPKNQDDESNKKDSEKAATKTAADKKTAAKKKNNKKKTTTKNYGTLKGDNDEEKQGLLPGEAAADDVVDPETLKPHQPPQNACLWLFHLLEGISATAALLLLVTQIVPFFLVKFGEIPARIGVLNMALKVYISLFCGLFALTETSAPVPFIRNSSLLQTYLSRGIMYSFLGLICVQEAYSERVKDIVQTHTSDEFHISWAAIFMEVSSWLMLGSGVVYTLMGMCCLKRLRDRLKQQEIENWKRYREELKEWKDLYT